MAFEAKPISTHAEEKRSSIEKTKAELDLVPGADASQRALYEEFAAKDEEWRAHMDKKLLRKVDLRMLPCLVMLYLLNFLDRSDLAQARLGGLEADLGMEGTDFNLATSIFFVGYLCVQLPSNMLITRVRPSIYLGIAAALGTVPSFVDSYIG